MQISFHLSFLFTLLFVALHSVSEICFDGGRNVVKLGGGRERRDMIYVHRVDGTDDGWF